MTDPAVALAERVAAVLESHGAQALVIGGAALAVHGHPRATEDLDLAVAVPPKTLRALAEALAAAGIESEASMPDAHDPLGGVLTIRDDGAVVQVVNFDNAPGGGSPRLVQEALTTALPLSGTSLRVADLASLIAFKLYAGGAASTSDILAVLEASPDAADLEAIRARCRALRLDRALERVLALRESSPQDD